MRRRRGLQVIEILRCVPLFVALFPSLLFGGTISLDVRTQAGVRQGVLSASVSAVNRGSESAHNLQVKIEGPGFSWESPLQPRLPVQRTHVATCRQVLGKLPPGRHPLVVRVHYTDANQYSFSALSVATFAFGKDAGPGIVGILEPGARMQSRGRMDLSLKNMEDRDKRLSVRLHLPQELTPEPALLEKRLGPLEEARIRFRVRNFSALAGSTYPVYATLEYEQDGRRHTAVAAGVLQVEAGRPVQKYRWILAGAFLALLAAFILWNALARRSRR